jgi:hypothetical protein
VLAARLPLSHCRIAPRSLSFGPLKIERGRGLQRRDAEALKRHKKEEKVRQKAAEQERKRQKYLSLHRGLCQVRTPSWELSWVTLRARWVTLRARWVTRRARWVTLRARWVTLRARWVTLGPLCPGAS